MVVKYNTDCVKIYHDGCYLIANKYVLQKFNFIPGEINMIYIICMLLIFYVIYSPCVSHGVNKKLGHKLNFLPICKEM